MDMLSDSFMTIAEALNPPASAKANPNEIGGKLQHILGYVAIVNPDIQMGSWQFEPVLKVHHVAVTKDGFAYQLQFAAEFLENASPSDFQTEVYQKLHKLGCCRTRSRMRPRRSARRRWRARAEDIPANLRAEGRPASASLHKRRPLTESFHDT
jgi:hypothetical protein